MPSALERLCGPSKPLKAEPADAREFAGLVRVAEARLHDAGNSVLALESRFDLAYNAAHALCLAALRWHGFRSKHRYIVFQLLPYTLGLGAGVWRVLSECHEVRNLGEYEGHLNVDEHLLAELIVACGAVVAKVKALPGIGSQGGVL